MKHVKNRDPWRYAPCGERRRGSGTNAALANDAHIVRIDQIGCGPAVQVVLRHARIRESLPSIILPGGDRSEQRVPADLLMAAGVIHLIEFVPCAEFGANRIP